MSKDGIKRRQAELLAQAVEFSAKITASPASYALGVPDATALAADVADFSTKLGLATDPATRTRPVVWDKSLSMLALIARMRSYGQRIQANPAVAEALKIGLGLTPRDREPTPVPPPALAPLGTILAVFGRTIRYRMADAASPSRRGSPEGVAGVTVLSHVGEQPPENLDGWTFEGDTSRTAVDVVFPSTVPAGATVWITARWYNAKAQPGPAATPVTAVLAGSATQAA